MNVVEPPRHSQEWLAPKLAIRIQARLRSLQCSGMQEGTFLDSAIALFLHVRASVSLARHFPGLARMQTAPLSCKQVRGRV